MGTKWKNIRSNITTKIILFIILVFCSFNVSWNTVHLMEQYDIKDMSFSSIFATDLASDINTSYTFRRITYNLSDKFTDKNLWAKDLDIVYQDKIYYYIEGYNGVVLTNNKNLNINDYRKSKLFLIAEDNPILEMSSRHFLIEHTEGIDLPEYAIESAFYDRPNAQLQFYKDGYREDEFDIYDSLDNSGREVVVTEIKADAEINKNNTEKSDVEQTSEEILHKSDLEQTSEKISDKSDEDVKNTEEDKLIEGDKYHSYAQIIKQQDEDVKDVNSSNLDNTNTELSKNKYPEVRIKKMYFKFKDEYAEQMVADFYTNKEFILSQLFKIALYSIIALLQVILLTMSAGHRKCKDGITLIKFDKIYFEIYFIVAITLASTIAISFVEIMNRFSRARTTIANIEVIITLGMVAPVCIISYMFYMSFVRRIKANALLKTSIFGIIFLKIKHFFRIIWKLINREDMPKTKTLFVLDIAYVALSAIPTLMMFYVMFKFREYGIAFIILILEASIVFVFIKLTSIVHNSIDSTVDERLENMLKSEKTKTELITGVSHDLKTPITSIVAYIDLLKKEDLSGKPKEYIDILDSKARNLSEMVKDLFDIAKTASGEISIERENIDINKLLRQTLADMQDKIAVSEFIIKENYSDDELIINSDGKKLYRVMQNLIDNALKYSLKGSRIYIQTQRVETNDICIKITNTASYEMNFDTDDIKKRFSRADKSRSEEGSGLGLAIASTYISALGGSFDIEVDGDQFKAIVELKSN